MLLCTRTHFIRSLEAKLRGDEGDGTAEEKEALGREMEARMRLYARDETASAPGVDVWFWKGAASGATGTFTKYIDGVGPQPGQRIVYVDGGYDLFCSGHIEFLRQVVLEEERLGRERGWYGDAAVSERKEKSLNGRDYPPAFVVVGVHEDSVINKWKGVNYPIMNIFERGLCVLQCKVSLLALKEPRPLI